MSKTKFELGSSKIVSPNSNTAVLHAYNPAPFAPKRLRKKISTPITPEYLAAKQAISALARRAAMKFEVAFGPLDEPYDSNSSPSHSF
jgi:hypothetical protein